jgi:hypothetical protein
MELSLTRAPLRRRSGTEPDDGLLPEPTPGADTNVRFTYYRKTNNKLCVVSIMVANMMTSAVPLAPGASAVAQAASE